MRRCPPRQRVGRRGHHLHRRRLQPVHYHAATTQLSLQALRTFHINRTRSTSAATPKGAEATLGWPLPRSAIFANRHPQRIHHQTSHTALRSPPRSTAATADSSSRLDCRDGTAPHRVVTSQQNDELAAPYCSEATARTVQTGPPGWSVTVYRYITSPDGTPDHRVVGTPLRQCMDDQEWDASDSTCAAPPP